jgi:hypothetical protein
MEKYPNGTTMPNLATQVSKMLATPSAWDCQGTHGGGQGKSLRTDIAMLPTATTRDWKGARKPETYQAIGRNPATNDLEGAIQSGTKTGLKLQPNFVEWMMGYPQNWTDLNFQNQNIESNDSKRSEIVSYRKLRSNLCEQLKKGECDMSMETELGRIADALERIEAKMFAPQVVTVAPEEQATAKPVAKRKNSPSVKTTANIKPESELVAEIDFGGKSVEQENTMPLDEPSMTPDEFLKYCNGLILGTKDVTKRSKMVAEIKNTLKKDYGVESIKALPADKIGECQVKFDKIMGV